MTTTLPRSTLPPGSNSLSPIINFSDCLTDSPRFRSSLQSNEVNLEELESRLERLLKHCNVMSEGGRNYVSQQTQFLATLWELNSYFAATGASAPHERSCDVAGTLVHLNQLIHTVQEIIKLQNSVVDSAAKAITKSLTKFVKEDMKQMKDTRGYFNKVSNDLDSVLQKNATVSKSRPSDIEDAANLLTATQSCFRYTSLDYVYQISMLQSRKKHEVLEVLLEFIKTYGNFFTQGANLFTNIEPFTRDLAKDIGDMKAMSNSLEKQLEKRHTHVSGVNAAGQTVTLPNSSSSSSASASTSSSATAGKGEVKLEGYLFKRGQNAFRTWNRRWFYLQNNKLCYSKRSGEDVTVMEEDLRICLVRPLMDIDRRYCFEVISPTKSHILQADSDEIAKNWITSLQQGISSALQETIHEKGKAGAGGMMMGLSSTSEPPLQWEDSDNEGEGGSNNTSLKNSGKAGGYGKRSAKQILLIPGNEQCADCGSPDPKWASINLGITLCIECSGVHRSLGVHISKVRSVTLDAWEPEILKVMAELGNTISNKIYEANVHEVIAARARSSSAGEVRENWIKAKYVAKAFIRDEIFDPEKSTPIRKWTVRRLRRRARTSSLKRQSAKEKLGRDDKDEDTSLDDKQQQPQPSVRPKATSAFSPRINAEEILFGSTLGKHHVANIELDSDQESTDGESEERADGTPGDLDSYAPLTANHLLFRAARVHNLPVMSQALASGANKDWRSEEEEGVSSAVIHQSIVSGSVMACEFLLLNGAKIDVVDLDGNTPLHLAAKAGNTGQACLLLKHRANHHLRNRAGETALDIAVKNSDADIVTLLRLADLNEEIRENDMSGGDDATFNDVVQEFSQMVYTHPERLHKKATMRDSPDQSRK